MNIKASYKLAQQINVFKIKASASQPLQIFEKHKFFLKDNQLSSFNLRNARFFSIKGSSFARDIGKEASEALSVSSSRIKEANKLQKRNNLRRLKPSDPEDLKPDLEGIFPRVSAEPKRQCKAFCTAEEYDFGLLLPKIRAQFPVVKVTDDVYNVKLSTSAESSEEKGEIFLFKAGTFVYWGSSNHEAEWFLDNMIKKNSSIEKGRYEEYETEYFNYQNNSSREAFMSGDIIYLGEIGDSLPYKLAFSHGLARSAKLSILEDMLDTLLESMSHYPLILQSGKKLPLTRKEILHKLGHVFLLRGILNLQSESFLDTPDYYWSKPQLEKCYDTISRNLDIRPRIAILNKKLDYANELTGLLREQLSESHSHKLEWCIIALITIDILFEIIHYLDRYSRP